MILSRFLFIIFLLPMGLFSATSRVSFAVETNPQILLIGGLSFTAFISRENAPVPRQTCLVSRRGEIEIKDNPFTSWSLTLDGQIPGQFVLLSDDKELYFQIFTDTAKNGLSKVGAISMESGVVNDNAFLLSNLREILNPGEVGNLITASSSKDLTIGLQSMISGENWVKAAKTGAFEEARTFKGTIIWTFIAN